MSSVTISRQDEVVRLDGEPMPPKLDEHSPTGRLNVTATEALIERLMEWRARQRPIPTKAEAARILIERALDAEDEKRRSAST